MVKFSYFRASTTLTPNLIPNQSKCYIRNSYIL